MPIGDLTAFLQYLLQILFAVLTAVFMFVFIPRAAVSAGRIRDVLEMKPSVDDPAAAAAASWPGSHGTVEFRDVEFRYPGAEQPGPPRDHVHARNRARRRRSSAAPARQVDARQPHPAASTTPRRGSVLVDGVDVRELARADLWRRIGLVPQKAFLFSGTVASNLRFGDEHATDDELWHALEIAQAADFVREMEGGLEAPITPGRHRTCPAASGSASRSPGRS